MFSLQRALGEDDRVLDLLESSALEACESVAALQKLLAGGETAALATFSKAMSSCLQGKGYTVN